RYRGRVEAAGDGAAADCLPGREVHNQRVDDRRDHKRNLPRISSDTRPGHGHVVDVRQALQARTGAHVGAFDRFRGGVPRQRFGGVRHTVDGDGDRECWVSGRVEPIVEFSEGGGAGQVRVVQGHVGGEVLRVIEDDLELPLLLVVNDGYVVDAVDVFQ